jgi:anti-sigma regulatory factor (Ser/Thr protein kinase)
LGFLVLRRRVSAYPRETIDLERDATAPSLARKALKAALEGRVPVEALGRALLITSEIVTYSVQHGDRQARTLLHIAMEADEQRLRVAVSDRALAIPLSGVSARPTEGLRLVILERLADRWGMTREGSSVQLWFETDLPPVPNRRFRRS